MLSSDYDMINLKQFDHSNNNQSDLTVPAPTVVSLLKQVEKSYSGIKSNMFHERHIFTKVVSHLAVTCDLDEFQCCNLGMTILRHFITIR